MKIELLGQIGKSFMIQQAFSFILSHLFVQQQSSCCNFNSTIPETLALLKVFVSLLHDIVLLLTVQL